MTIHRQRQTDPLQLNVVELCHEYHRLKAQTLAGSKLGRLKQRRLGSLERIFEGDPTGRRREHRRLPLLIPVAVSWGGGTAQGTALNISGGGCHLMLPEELLPETPVTLQFGDGAQADFCFQGVVRWRREYGQMSSLGVQHENASVRRASQSALDAVASPSASSAA